MPVEIPPITASSPIVVPPIGEKVFGTWFLTDFRLVATPERKFDAEVFWQLGRLYDVDVEVSTQVPREEGVVDGEGNPVMIEKRDPETNEIIYVVDPETGLPTEVPEMVQQTQTVYDTVVTTETQQRSELTDTRRTAYVRDILSDAFLVANPEIAAILPGFLGSLIAISQRQGAI